MKEVGEKVVGGWVGEAGEDMVVLGWVGEVGEKVVADWVGEVVEREAVG